MNDVQVKRLAKQYVIALLRGQDEPEWMAQSGVPEEKGAIFMGEIRRIASSIERTLPENQRETQFTPVRQHSQET